MIKGVYGSGTNISSISSGSDGTDISLISSGSDCGTNISSGTNGTNDWNLH